MSKASLWGIRPDGTGKCLQEYSNSFLYAPAVLRILTQKYNISYTTLPGVWERVSEESAQYPEDDICWNFLNSDVFLSRDRKEVSKTMKSFAREHANSALNVLADDIRGIPEEYAFFVFQATDVDSFVEDWFSMDGKETSLFDQNEYVTDFILFHSEGIQKIPNLIYRKNL